MPADGMTLAELIWTVKGHGKRGGMTYEQLADRRPIDEETGKPYGPDSDRLEQMVRYPLKAFPAAKTIQGLAIMLRVTEQTVVDACARSLGLKITRTPSRLEALLPPTGSFSDQAVSNVLSVVHAELSVEEARAAEEAKAQATKATKRTQRKGTPRGSRSPVRPLAREPKHE